MIKIWIIYIWVRLKFEINALQNNLGKDSNVQNPDSPDFEISRKSGTGHDVPTSPKIILGENRQAALPRPVPKIESMLHNKGPNVKRPKVSFGPISSIDDCHDTELCPSVTNKRLERLKPKRSASFKSFFRGSKLNLAVVDLGIIWTLQKMFWI